MFLYLMHLPLKNMDRLKDDAGEFLEKKSSKMITSDDEVRLWKIFTKVIPNFVKIPLDKRRITYSIKIRIKACIFYGLINYLKPIHMFHPEETNNWGKSERNS